VSGRRRRERLNLNRPDARARGTTNGPIAFGVGPSRRAGSSPGTSPYPATATRSTRRPASQGLCPDGDRPISALPSAAPRPPGSPDGARASAAPHPRRHPRHPRACPPRGTPTIRRTRPRSACPLAARRDTGKRARGRKHGTQTPLRAHRREHPPLQHRRPPPTLALTTTAKTTAAKAAVVEARPQTPAALRCQPEGGHGDDVERGGRLHYKHHAKR